MRAISRASLAAATVLVAAVASHSPFGSAQGDLELVERSTSLMAAIHAAGPRVAPADVSEPTRQQLPDGPGKELLPRLCGGCHDLTFTVSTRETNEGWTRIVNDMRSKGADGTEEEFAKVIAYLTANMGKPEARAGVFSRPPR
jgi:hypothetical protein